MKPQSIEIVASQRRKAQPEYLSEVGLRIRAWRISRAPIAIGPFSTSDPMSPLDLPMTRYAQSGDLNIAYQTMGKGPIDLILVPGLTTHVEFLHEIPGYTDFLRRLAAFARVVTFDKSGQGLSDRAFGVPSLEQRMDDIRAVMDDIGSTRAALLGCSEGAAISVMFGATYPERFSSAVSRE